ncbi:MAG: TraR/DksA family transcriptional regulator [candidate division NC10 bacterium]|nr:TraR/DksA family transcriptional regulator [candidate division NC10 bacterium]
MKAAKLEELKRKLLEKRKELISEVRNSSSSSIEAGNEGTQDIADQASSAYTKEFLLSIGDNERRLLKLVDAALEKIRLKTYGRCEKCGGFIGEKRLEALPFARFCLSCQEAEERRQG